MVAYQYTDFGETSKKGGVSFHNEICYTGGIYDESTGLYYLNARYYNSSDGRFVSEDPVLDGSNWYIYCLNDPVNYLDPSGHKYIKIQDEFELINKRYMKDIPVGEWGNVADNGCGSIAVYNVMVSQGFKGNFFYINSDLQRSGYDYIGVGGLNPLSVKSFMKERFTNVKTAVANKYRWMSIGKESEAVIALFAWPGFSGAHYVAGIKAKNGAGRKFRFYNTFSWINGKKITMKKFINTLEGQECKRLYLVGIKGKKDWW